MTIWRERNKNMLPEDILRSIFMIWTTLVFACGIPAVDKNENKKRIDVSGYLKNFTIIPSADDSSQTLGPVGIQQAGDAICLLTGWSISKGVIGESRKIRMDSTPNDSLTLLSDGNIEYNRSNLFGTFNNSFQQEKVNSAEHFVVNFSIEKYPEDDELCSGFWDEMKAVLNAPSWCWSIPSEQKRYCTLIYRMVNPLNSPIGIQTLTLSGVHQQNAFAGMFTGAVLEINSLEIASDFTSETDIKSNTSLTGTVSIQADFTDYTCQGKLPATLEIRDSYISMNECEVSDLGYQRRGD